MYTRESAKADLLELGIMPGSVIYVTTRSVARSGMSRTMSLFVVNNGEIRDITFLVANVFGHRVTDVLGSRTIRLHGAGMDMHFYIVYELGRALFGDGYALTKRSL